MSHPDQGFTSAVQLKMNAIVQTVVGRLCLLVHTEKTPKRPAKSTGQTSPSRIKSLPAPPPYILLHVNTSNAARNRGVINSKNVRAR